MKLRLFDKRNILKEDEAFSIKGKTVKVLNGSFIISKKERKEMVDFCQKKWKRIWQKADPDNFVGHVRFDLIPEVENNTTKEEKGSYDFGKISIKGLYEINTHSPECSCAVSAAHKVFPELKETQPSTTKKLAKEIKKKFETTKVSLLQGSAAAKKSWGDYFIEDMKDVLMVDWTDKSKIKKEKPSLLYRWGDVRFNESSEFSNDTEELLLKMQNDSVIVFNTIPSSPEKDVGNKEFILEKDKGEYMINSEADLEKIWNLPRENYILKPLRGSRGEKIIFGRKENRKDWENYLKRAVNDKGKYGIFKAKWLPKIKIKNNYYAFDVNPSFWADGSNIRYLYSVSRIDRYNRYWKAGVINVCQGAGFAGALVEK